MHTIMKCREIVLEEGKFWEKGILILLFSEEIHLCKNAW